jgi:hypothetical protein
MFIRLEWMMKTAFALLGYGGSPPPSNLMS